MPFVVRILWAALRTAVAFWGALWAVLQTVTSLPEEANQTASAPLTSAIGVAVKSVIIFGLDHPIEIAWGHILAGFFWAIMVDAPRQKIRLRAKKTVRAVKVRKAKNER